MYYDLVVQAKKTADLFATHETDMSGHAHNLDFEPA
jgi:hypothetical protein